MAQAARGPSASVSVPRRFEINPFQLYLVSLPPQGSQSHCRPENVSEVLVNKVLPEDEARERLKVCGESIVSGSGKKTRTVFLFTGT